MNLRLRVLVAVWFDCFVFGFDFVLWFSSWLICGCLFVVADCLIVVYFVLAWYLICLGIDLFG